MNLICFNLNESDDKSSDVRIDHDKTRFRELCKSIGVQDPDIKIIFRLGTHQTGNTKPRPLKVVLNNKKQRKEIMDNTSKIRHLPSTSGLNRCIIVKDLTIRQRNERKQKRAEKQKVSIERESNNNNTKDKNDIFNDDTVKDSTVIEATLRNLNDEDEIEEMVQSQNILEPIILTKSSTQNLTVEVQLHKDRHSQVSPFSDLGDETILGGFDTQGALNDSMNES